jgi:regulatory protein
MDVALQQMLLKKAGTLLARRAYGRGELRDKLCKLAEAVEVEVVLDRLEQLNLLNDADYAYNFAFYRIAQDGWGPAKVHDSLLRRRVEPRTIERALERVQSELGDESALADYIRKHCGKKGLPADPKDVRRLILHLRRRGFEEKNIFSALRQMIPAALIERFETGE